MKKLYLSVIVSVSSIAYGAGSEQVSAFGGFARASDAESAAQRAPRDDTNEIMFKFDDGTRKAYPADFALQFETIKNMQEDLGKQEDPAIPLPKINQTSIDVLYDLHIAHISNKPIEDVIANYKDAIDIPNLLRTLVFLDPRHEVLNVELFEKTSFLKLEQKVTIEQKIKAGLDKEWNALLQDQWDERDHLRKKI